MSYIWENESWPLFAYNSSCVSEALERLREEKRIADIAFSVIDEQTRKQLEARSLADDIISSFSIEGEAIDADSVYSSVSKHLDVIFTGKPKESAYAQSILSMVIDALENHAPLTHQRLFDWHVKLFQNKAGIRPKTIGGYRKAPEYVMKGSGRNQKIVYEAVKHECVREEMERLLSFVNEKTGLDPFIKAAVASLWFVLIHPFEDGNGRISRAIADYVISLDSCDALHAFNISTGILKNRNSYYDHIQAVSTDNPGMDVSSWVAWFLNLVSDCIAQSLLTLKKTLSTTAFMKALDPNEFNSREMSMLYKLADGSFFGKLTTDKWMKMTKCSKTAAFRDIQHLVEKGFLTPSDEAGRNRGYFFNQSVVDGEVSF